jgi:4-alpha-glucanotransferase
MTTKRPTVRQARRAPVRKSTKTTTAAKAPRHLLSDRASGLLLHVTSLPGPRWNGDLGAEAHAFVDFLARAGQRWWQMLPVNPIGPGHSPYSTISSFAGEPLLIDLVDLRRRGLLKATDVAAPKGGAGGRVNYRKAFAYRERLLRQAFAKARADRRFFTSAAFTAFKAAEGGLDGWLDDYTLFGAIAALQGTADWRLWPEALRRRDPSALKEADLKVADERRYLEFLQFVFAEQWQALKSAAAARGVGLIGDLPIFVGFKSADVWAHPDYFLLDSQRSPAFVAGCPPDAFNKSGQLWGNALYDWRALQKQGFDWWLARLRKMLTLFDAVRLDHFIGFYRYWRIPAAARTARDGTWQMATGDAFFTAVQKAFPALPFIAEDLGAVIPPVRALRDKFGLPGMKVLQFGFDGSEEAAEHQPHNFARASAVYTGTHDNDTVVGWLASLTAHSRRDKQAAAQLAAVRAYLGCGRDGRGASAALVRIAMQSPANVCVTPVQDLLGLGGAHRMNVPGSAAGNWEWRVPAGSLTPAAAAELQALTQATGRL